MSELKNPGIIASMLNQELKRRYPERNLKVHAAPFDSKAKSPIRHKLTVIDRGVCVAAAEASMEKGIHEILKNAMDEFDKSETLKDPSEDVGRVERAIAHLKSKFPRAEFHVTLWPYDARFSFPGFAVSFTVGEGESYFSSTRVHRHMPEDQQFAEIYAGVNHLLKFSRGEALDDNLDEESPY